MDGARNKIAGCPKELPREEEEEERQGILDTNAGFYNRKILKVSEVIIIVMTICPVQASSQPQSPDQQQSPTDLGPGEPDPSLGPISFLYTPVLETDPKPWRPWSEGALTDTVVSSQVWLSCLIPAL